MPVKHKNRTATHPLQENPSEYCYVNGKKKRKYKTQADAELFAPAKGLSQYVCEYCRFWHNGKSTTTIK